jgi:putative hemolysin
MADSQIARDISYASSAKGRTGRTLIRVVENATGRLGLIRKAKGYDIDVAEGADFWKVITDRYGLTLDVAGGTIESIPKVGPLIVVSNHPYGVLDGLMMGRILSERREGDFRILANSVFRRSPDLERVILPISFDETKEAVKQNIETRATALSYLRHGGAIGVFPGGTVSTAPKPFGKPVDPRWRSFTAKMIAKSDAVVVPIFFDGANSRLFQLASHLHMTLRLSLLIREFKARVNTKVRVVIGEPIPTAKLAPYAKDPKAMMDFLRKATYVLSPEPIDANTLGRDYEAKKKGQPDGGRDIR